MNVALLKKCLACCLAVLLIASSGQTFASPTQSPQNQQVTQPAAADPTTAAPAQSAGQNTVDGAQTSPAQQPANKPLGTAVAPYEKTSGVTASRPAGAVIAPAKQRRVHAILIKIGLVVGAAAAVGAVVALSHGSSSQPH